MFVISLGVHVFACIKATIGTNLENGNKLRKAKAEIPLFDARF